MKNAVVLLARGFEDIEALTPVDILRRGNVNCKMASVDGGDQEISSRNTIIKTDEILDNIHVENYDALILPGGIPGALNLRDNEKVIKLVKRFNEEGKLVAAICAAPIVLQRAGILEGRKVTSNPNFKDELGNSDYREDLVVQDGNIVTSRGAATAIYFAFKILENLVDREIVEKVEKSTVMNLVNDHFYKGQVK